MLPIKVLHHDPFLNLYRIQALELTMHQELISKLVQHGRVEKLRKREKKL